MLTLHFHIGNPKVTACVSWLFRICWLASINQSFGSAKCVAVCKLIVLVQGGLNSPAYYNSRSRILKGGFSFWQKRQPSLSWRPKKKVISLYTPLSAMCDTFHCIISNRTTVIKVSLSNCSIRVFQLPGFKSISKGSFRPFVWNVTPALKEQYFYLIRIIIITNQDIPIWTLSSWDCSYSHNTSLKS